MLGSVSFMKGADELCYWWKHASVKTGINWLNEKRNKLNENVSHSMIYSCFQNTILPQMTVPLLSIKAKHSPQSLFARAKGRRSKLQLRNAIGK